MQLNDLLASHIRIDTTHTRALEKLGIATVRDLLYHLPVRHENTADVRTLNSLTEGADAIVYGKISNLSSRKAWKSKRPIAEAWVEDGTARMKVIWFNQPYLAKMLTDGALVKLSGKVSGSGTKLFLANPDIEPLRDLPIDQDDSLFANTEHRSETLYPVYPESKGVTSRWFYHAVKRCFEHGILDTFEDPIPETIRERYNLPSLSTALQWIHTPKNTRHTESARKRFAFEEIFAIQTKNAVERAQISAATCYQFATNSDKLNAFVERFPFPLTNAQSRALDTLMEDINGKTPMSRLLEGDVGSGKTAVAATLAYMVAMSRPRIDKDYGNLQVAYMAPTEILAKQHFENFIEYFKHLPIQIGLITGSSCMKYPSKVDSSKPTKISKTQLLKWVENGEIPILIGTHALVYKKVQFKNLAQVIIDEQHRFGIKQRKALTQKGAPIPHLLSMTATPIPRTLALTIYGDLDLTLLDEMPAGRKKTITKLITPTDQDALYTHIRKELADGRQAYVICPRIDEPDPEKETTVEMKSVTAEADRLQNGPLKEYRIEILHGKMTPAEKDAVMTRFAAHEIDVLVATSVIEVGINVPNATNIIIEGSERFGLSQLHQLRGRVIRGTHQSYCFAATTSTATTTTARLKAFAKSTDGFELAEHDLTFRGTGELYGTKQSGLSDIGMDALQNLKLVEAARTEAQQLVMDDPTLADHPILKDRVDRLVGLLHME